MNAIVDGWNLAAGNPWPFVAWGVLVCAVTACVTAWYCKARERRRNAAVERWNVEPTMRSGFQADLIPQPPQHAFDELAQLLQEGLDRILNVRVKSESELADYLRFCDDWDKRLFKHMDENFPLPDAMHVRKLGGLVEIDFEDVIFKKQRVRMTWFCRREQLIRDVLKKQPPAASQAGPDHPEIEADEEAARYAVSR